MSSRAEQVLQVYRAARLDDQLRYYEKRRAEYERAHGELLIASAVLLGLTSTASALAGIDIGGKIVWAILAAILPALSTALAAYGGLFAFDRQAKLVHRRRAESAAARRARALTDARRAAGRHRAPAVRPAGRGGLPERAGSVGPAGCRVDAQGRQAGLIATQPPGAAGAHDADSIVVRTWRTSSAASGTASPSSARMALNASLHQCPRCASSGPSSRIPMRRSAASRRPQR